MIITIFKSIEEAKDTWIAFQKDSDFYPFQSYEWIYTWYKTVGKKNGVVPVIFKITIGDEDRLLLPMKVVRRKGLRVLKWLSDDKVFDYQGPIIKRKISSIGDVDYRKLVKRLHQSFPFFDYVDLLSQPEDIHEVPNGFALIGNCNKQCFARYLKIDNDWKSYYEKEIDSKIRRDTVRQKERLQKIDELKFVIVDNYTKESDIEKVYSAFVMQKERRYQETNFYNLFADEGYRKFYRRLLSSELIDGSLNVGDDAKKFNVHLSALYLGREIIATHFGLYDEKRYYYLMPTYKSKEIAKYSPGRILMLYLMEWAFDRGVKIFDFTIGAEQYKDTWCNGYMNFYRHEEPITYKGNLYHCLLQSKRWMKSSINKLFHNERCEGAM
ncbi:MAG: GNAT family N-acetyltransferase [Oligoflexia bacterium]|nr:GNAT family N-acetyltransferase [Oligoflexia bacterium]